jgi:hypothetical protein
MLMRVASTTRTFKTAERRRNGSSGSSFLAACD